MHGEKNKMTKKKEERQKKRGKQKKRHCANAHRAPTYLIESGGGREEGKS
jgi:hypothetical protein